MKILFCTAPHGPPERTGYDHGSVALAEGFEVLRRQGGDFAWSGTVPYWRRTPGTDDWLIPADGQVNWQNADVVVLSYLAIGEGQPLPDELSRRRAGSRVVFLDAMDGWRGFFLRPEMRQFDLVLRTHLNQRYPRPANVRPWAFGLTNRLVESCTGGSTPPEKLEQVLFNFRVGHPLRDWARERVLPSLAGTFALNDVTDLAPDPGSGVDRLYWEQTGRRHYPSYFKRLAKARLGTAYGGYFAPDWGLSLDSPLLRALYKAMQGFGLRSQTIVQFDSWRFWESLAAGALTLHVDLSRYGALFPVEPKNRVHYWAISPDTMESDLSELLAGGPSTWSRIAEEGKRWALANYSPEAQARRLLTWLEDEE